MSNKYITIDHGDGPVTHAFGGPGDYATLCGCSDNDDYAAIPTPRGQKIDCASCLSIWKQAKTYRSSDFEEKSHG